MLRNGALLLMALTAASCATIAHGPNETISVESSPTGAGVQLRCAQMTRTGVSPLTLTIPRRAGDCTITVSKEGFKPKSIELERGISKQYWLNFIGVGVLPLGISDGSPLSISGDAGLALILAGGLGLAIDRIDGSMYQHSPTSVRLVLDPE